MLNFSLILEVNVSYESQSFNSLTLVVVNIDKIGQPMRNCLENIVLDRKTIFSGARPTDNDNHYKEQHCNRPSRSNHYA